MHQRRIVYLACLTLALLQSTGCSSSWHDKCIWEAEDYFEDPQVIALCKAIEADDLEEMDRLIDAGANVNAIGKGNMTPLLWAFPDHQLERFKLLLEHGADPNVIFKSHFNTRGGLEPGYSVTHMACRIRFPGYFEAVFNHGGDPNLEVTEGIAKGDTPLCTLIRSPSPNKKENVRRLLQLGTDIDHRCSSGGTPAELAVTHIGQYDLALMLLEAGADYNVYKPKSNSRLIHLLAREQRWTAASPEIKAQYDKLVKWLEDHGESIEEAKSDRERWESWSITTGEYRRNMDAEIAARKVKETSKQKNEQ